MHPPLLLSLLILLVPQNNAPNQKKAQEQIPAKQIQPPEVTQQSSNAASPPVIKFYTNNTQQENNSETAKIIFDGLLVLATGGLVWVGIRQANILNRQANILVKHEEWMQKHDAKLEQLANGVGDNAKSAREHVSLIVSKERARLLVQQPGTVLPDLIQPMEKDMPYYRVPVPLFHHGNTDAFNVRMFGNAFTDKSRDAAFSANEQVHIPVFIRPTREPVEAYLTSFFPDEDEDKLDSGGLSFHVCGKITYEDVYGKAQETTFWYVWDAQIIDIGGGAKHIYLSWKLNGPPECNRAT